MTDGELLEEGVERRCQASGCNQLAACAVTLRADAGDWSTPLDLCRAHALPFCEDAAGVDLQFQVLSLEGTVPLGASLSPGGRATNE